MNTIGFVRPILKDDCAAILCLIQALADYEKAPDAVSITLEELESGGFGRQPVWWGFLVEENKIIVGFALYYIRFSTWTGQKMYLEDLYIKTEKRGLGYGKLLFNQLIEEAKNKNLKGICWQVLKWNQPAIEFYTTYKASFDDEWFNASIPVQCVKNGLAE